MRRPVASITWGDCAFALAVVGMCEIQFGTEQGQHRTEALTGPLWVGILSGLVLGIPLVWRRRFPVAAALAVFGAALLVYLLGLSGYGYFGEIIAGLAVLFTVANRRSLRVALLVFGYAYACVVASTVPLGFYNHVGTLLLLGAPWMVGRVTRSRQLLIDQLHATTAQLQASRAQNEAAAVAAERVRIARELHDIVAHAVSVMVVQAGAAERKLDRHPDLAHEPLIAIQNTGRQALGELRRLLRVLRPDVDGDQTLTPQPGLADLESLADGIRNAGLAVELRREDAGCVLPEGVDLAAFRIVQEALTNSLKHARADSVRVVIRVDGDMLELDIIDDGRGRSAGRLNGSERGIAGMRERVALYGGDIATGPHQGGGFAVRARLPVATQA
jgi:signal transduction histidine kinase